MTQTNVDSQSFFNVLLSDIGVRNVKVQEVLSLDEELLALLPQPVFGLIFLSQHFDEVADERKDEEGMEDVWFANQASWPNFGIPGHICGL